MIYFISNNIKIRAVLKNELEKKLIEKALKRHWSINADDIQVTVVGNEVILTGKVTSMYQKEEASKIAWKTPGVWSVNNKLVVVAVPTMTKNVRIAKFLGSCTDEFFFLLEAICSCGANQANKTPHKMDTAPGTMKATRHPCQATKKPVINAAMAIPKLPAKPFTPMVNPGRFDF